MSVPTQRPVCRNQRRHLERAPPEPSPATLRELPIRLHIGSAMSPGAAPEPDERIVGQRRRAVRAAQLVRCQPVAKLIPDQAGQTRRQTRIRIHLRLPQQPQPQPGAGNSTGCVRVIRPDLIPVVKRHPQATLRQPLHRLHTTRDGPLAATQITDPASQRTSHPPPPPEGRLRNTSRPETVMSDVGKVESLSLKSISTWG